MGLVANAPDSDGDGIQDGIEPVPNLANNLCAGTDPVLEQQMIATDVICAGRNSVTVEGAVKTRFNGSLLIISPNVEFKPAFGAESSGAIKGQSVGPCSVCN